MIQVMGCYKVFFLSELQEIDQILIKNKIKILYQGQTIRQRKTVIKIIHTQSLTTESKLYKYAACVLTGKQLPRKGTENLQLVFKHKLNFRCFLPFCVNLTFFKKQITLMSEMLWERIFLGLKKNPSNLCISGVLISSLIKLSKFGIYFSRLKNTEFSNQHLKSLNERK